MSAGGEVDLVARGVYLLLAKACAQLRMKATEGPAFRLGPPSRVEYAAERDDDRFRACVMRIHAQYDSGCGQAVSTYQALYIGAHPRLFLAPVRSRRPALPG